MDAITYRSSIDDIDVILQCGGDVNKTVKQGLTPLHYAAYVNYVECVKFLIECGGEIDAVDEVGHTPLHLCARKGHFDTMKYLVQKGAKINFCDGDDDVSENSRTLGYYMMEPLTMAIENNKIACVKLLLENGANPNNKYFMGHEINIVPLDNLECLNLLLSYGANPNILDRMGLCPLMKACKEHQVEAVRVLMKHGADVNARCSTLYEEKTVLHFAVLSGNVIITSELLERGASTKKPEGYKYSVLQTAINRDRVDLCEMLLKHGADVEERSEEHATPLMYACSNSCLKNHGAIMKLLLNHGANPNAHSNLTSYTDPSLSSLSEYLQNFAELSQYECVHMLIKYGARVNFRGASVRYRLQDPFGILKYLPYIAQKWDIVELLMDAAWTYDPELIKKHGSILTSQRKAILEVAMMPRSLKQIIRLLIRQVLTPSLPNKVELLPLPPLLKCFLLFEV